MVNVWRLIAFQDKGCRRQLVIQWAINNERIAIGWGRIGNLGQYATEQNILVAAQNYLCPQQYPQDKPLQKCVRILIQIILLSSGASRHTDQQRKGEDGFAGACPQHVWQETKLQTVNR